MSAVQTRQGRPVGSKCLKRNDRTNGIPSEWLRVRKGFHLATAVTCLPRISVCPVLDQALSMYWLIHDGIWLLFFRAERITGIKGSNQKPGCKSGLRYEGLERPSSDFACLKINRRAQQGHCWLVGGRVTLSKQLEEFALLLFLLIVDVLCTTFVHGFCLFLCL